MSRESQGSHVELKAGSVQHCWPTNPVAFRMPRLQDSSKNALRELLPAATGSRTEGGGRETESRSSHFLGIIQEKRWVRRSGHRPARCLLSPTAPTRGLHDEHSTSRVATASARHIA